MDPAHVARRFCSQQFPNSAWCLWREWPAYNVARVACLWREWPAYNAGFSCMMRSVGFSMCLPFLHACSACVMRGKHVYTYRAMAGRCASLRMVRPVVVASSFAVFCAVVGIVYSSALSKGRQCMRGWLQGAPGRAWSRGRLRWTTMACGCAAVQHCTSRYLQIEIFLNFGD